MTPRDQTPRDQVATKPKGFKVWLRSAGIAILAISAVSILAGAAMQVALNDAFRGLPTEVLDQNRDIAVMIADIDDLLGAIAIAHAAPTPERASVVDAFVTRAMENMARIRSTYNFDNRVGASAMHALVNPALLDVRRWRAEGVSGLPPESPLVLELSYRRIQEAYLEIRRLFDRAHDESRLLLVEQEKNAETFRIVLSSITVFAAALLLALAALLARQRRINVEIERVAEEVTIARDAAERANRAKGDFLSKMSHELRTPLNAIIGFSEILKDQLHGPIDQPKYVEYVGDIHTSGEHLLSIINDILDLTRVESGRFVVARQTVSVDELARSATRIVEPRITRTGVAFSYRAPSPLPALVVDRRAMRQVLVNVLGNAAKFTSRGSIVLEADRDPEGGFAFTIRDTGIGMSAADIETALTPFGQVETVITRRHEGTGLGLPLARALVELHGGALTIQSALGVGTTVTISLPPACVVQLGAKSAKLRAVKAAGQT